MPDPLITPRKQPRQKRSAATVAVILEAAAHILDQGCPDAFTTNAVADRAGISIGSLYQYFPNKHALMAALVRKDNQIFLDAMSRAAAVEQGGPRRRLRRLLAVAVDHRFDRPKLARILDWQHQRLLSEDPTLAVVPEVAERISGVVAQAGIPADRIRQASIDVVGMACGMIRAAATHGDAKPPDLHDRLGRAVAGYLERSAP